MTEQAIIQIADYGGPYRGSFIPSLLRLRESALETMGLDTIFVFSDAARCRPWVAHLANAGARVAFIERGAPRGSRLRTITRIAQERSGSLLHSHFGSFDIDCALAGRLSHGSTVLWHAHSLPRRIVRRPSLRDLVRWRVIPNLAVDRIVAVSDAVADSLRDRGACDNKIVVIGNGIDTNRFRPPEPLERQTLMSRHGIPPEARVVLFFGWSPFIKGLDIFLEATRRLQGVLDPSPYYLVVSGEKNQRDIESLTPHDSRVHVIPPTDDIDELYRVASCFISASRLEGFSYALGEAMSSGLPVISSDLPQLRSIFGPAGTGFRTFRSRDPGDLARSIGELLGGSDDELERLGVSNRKFVEGHLNLGHWCKSMLRIYEGVISGRE